MIDYFNPEVDRLDINDFEELTKLIVTGMLPINNSNTSFYQVKVHLHYRDNILSEMYIHMPYANSHYLDEELFIESMGVFNS